MPETSSTCEGCSDALTPQVILQREPSTGSARRPSRYGH